MPTEEPRCERILNEWKISHIDMVKNAIVIPSLLSGMLWNIHLPVSRNSPVKNAIRVRTVTITVSYTHLTLPTILLV